MQVEKTALRGYAPAIAEATGAPEALLPLLEEIMRTEIFHSTLDWQSAAEFREGARMAYALYRENRNFYDADARRRRAAFRVLVAEQALEELRGHEDGPLAAAQVELEAAKVEEAAARISLDEISRC